MLCDGLLRTTIDPVDRPVLVERLEILEDVRGWEIVRLVELLLELRLDTLLLDTLILELRLDVIDLERLGAELRVEILSAVLRLGALGRLALLVLDLRD